MDDHNSGESDVGQLDDEFIPHLDDGRPEALPHTQGAVVILRSGERALFPPGVESSIGQDHYWEKMFEYENDDDDIGIPSELDIVAYRPLPMTAGDELARAALNALRFVSPSLPENDFMSGHPIGESIRSFGAAQACERVKNAVAAYARSWPNDPALNSLRRLGTWGGDSSYAGDDDD